MAGANASAPEKNSWRALVTQALQAQYPDAKIDAVNTSVGGLGADYANFHLRYDTLPKKPDLIFTDAYCNGPGGDDLIRCNEGIVRQIRKELPDAEIVFTYIYTKAGGGVDRYYQKGETPKDFVQLHELCKHYGLVDIDLGKVMYDALQKQPATPLLSDVVHPSDAGHKLYADAIMQFLKERIVKGNSSTSVLPVPYKPNSMENPTIIDAEAAMKLGTGWKIDKKTIGFMPETLLVADPAKGAELTVSFTGTQCGLYWLESFEGGQIEWSVDGQPAQKLASASDFLIKHRTSVVTFRRCRFTNPVPYGEHKLTIRALPDKPAGSLGNVIKIGAIIAQ